MSRPKHYWYGIVKIMIYEYANHPDDATVQGRLYRDALSKANADTLRMENGELRLKAVEMVLIKKTRNVSGAAQALYYGERTVQGWINLYVNMVGRNAGF